MVRTVLLVVFFLIFNGLLVWYNVKLGDKWYKLVGILIFLYLLGGYLFYDGNKFLGTIWFYLIWIYLIIAIGEKALAVKDECEEYKKIVKELRNNNSMNRSK